MMGWVGPSVFLFFFLFYSTVLRNSGLLISVLHLFVHMILIVGLCLLSISFTCSILVNFVVFSFTEIMFSGHSGEGESSC